MPIPLLSPPPRTQSLLKTPPAPPQLSYWFVSVEQGHTGSVMHVQRIKTVAQLRLATQTSSERGTPTSFESGTPTSCEPTSCERPGWVSGILLHLLPRSRNILRHLLPRSRKVAPV
jgi:hypothetical protein